MPTSLDPSRELAADRLAFRLRRGYGPTSSAALQRRAKRSMVEGRQTTADVCAESADLSDRILVFGSTKTQNGA